MLEKEEQVIDYDFHVWYIAYHMKDFIHEQFLAAQQAAEKAAKEDALET